MQFAHVQQNNNVAAQVLRLSEDGYIMARAYVQPDGSLGAYSQEDGEEFYQGYEVYQSEAGARDSFNEFMEWAEHMEELLEQERIRARDILRTDIKISVIVALQDNIIALIEERDRLLKESGYEKMGDGDISWWGRKDLMEDQELPGSSFPTYH